ncbi:MAG: hypothetical protein WAX04_01270, partial [Oscillospiraceae bacterium]
KVNVEVNVHFDTRGNMTPLSIVWEDGHIFEVDKIIDKRQAASLKAGGQGVRYICRIQNKETHLFYENPNWFVEGK